VLKDSCRAGDLVARYGGEEFVMLCADCDNATAARRAEEIRRNISRISQPLMGGQTVSASFGVTEMQPGDSPETMLRRADRALLTAKARGRNCVVQLGSGSTAENPWLTDEAPVNRDHLADESQTLIEQELVTSVPMAVAIEKLRGFVADHQANLIETEGPNVELEMFTQPPEIRLRRSSDRPTTFVVKLRFEECGKEPLDHPCETKTSASVLPKTKIHFSISPKNNRDRRRKDAMEQASEILISFRSYLMATDNLPEKEDQGKIQDRHFCNSWLSSQLDPLKIKNEEEPETVSFWQSILRCFRFSK
jgi:hypothetical protein